MVGAGEEVSAGVVEEEEVGDAGAGEEVLAGDGEGSGAGLGQVPRLHLKRSLRYLRKKRSF